MPLFSRRRGSSVTRPVDTNTAAAASAAASSAFFHTAPSNASLSSAAAAAALRSQTSSPVPVGSIQTKRMVRRGSVSSVGSGSVIGAGFRGGTPVRGGLVRRESGGSMTERTFRSPSPGGRNGRITSPDSSIRDAPPVPELPTAARTRSASMEPPRRIISPSPASRGNRGASVDRPSYVGPSSKQAKRLSGVPELETEDSKKSTNFSRPVSSSANSPVSPSGKRSQPRPQSALAQPSWKATNTPTRQSQVAEADREETTSDSIMVFDPASRTFVPKPRDELPQEPDSPVQAASGYWDPHTRTYVQPQRQQRPQAQREGSYTESETSELGGTRKKTRPILSAVDTRMEPPPRNPARLSPGEQGASPSSPRATGFLHKQPSVVREDPEAEMRAEKAAPLTAGLKATGRNINTSYGPAKSYVAPATRVSHQRSTSLDIPRSPDGSTGQRGRQNSLSPRRSAHFSDSPVIAAMKHQPPARSISPIKSAMKQTHSAASSQRGGSPLPGALRGPGSDVGSDDASMASHDGVTPGSKKKKGARVSFDEQPHELVLPPTSTAAATPSAMQHSGRHVDLGDDEDDDDVAMKPRPALPSFGSVRKGRTVELPEKVTEQGPDWEDSGISSDHAIGGILKNGAQAQPAPPEVTSKESRSYDNDSSDDKARPNLDVPASTHDTLKAEAEKEIGKVKPNEDQDVPAINLMPPTPNIDEGRENEGALADKVSDTNGDKVTPEPHAEKAYFSVPGGWGEEGDDKRTEQAKDEPSDTAKRLKESSTPAIPSTTSGNAPQLPAIDSSGFTAGFDTDTGVGSPRLTDIEESDNSAEFSDAAEDLADLDGEGFGSLNAIVSSPAPSATKVTTPPESPTPAKVATTDPVAETPPRRGPIRRSSGSGDWTEATAYWRQLSRKQREQIEREHLSSEDETPVPIAALKKAKKKKSATIVPPTADEPPPERPHSSQGGQPPPAMKKSMRAEQPAPSAEDNAVHMRKSMRSGGAMRGSMRDSPAPARPQSEYIQPRGALQKKHIRTQSGSQLTGTDLPASVIGAALLQRQRSEESDIGVSQDSAFPKFAAKKNPTPANLKAIKPPPIPNDSDSESSFRKKRRSSVSTVDNAGRYNMRRSMRGGPVEPLPPSQHPATRQSMVADDQRRPVSPSPQGRRGSFLRSLSPTGSFMGRNKVGEQRETLRQSLRGSSVDTSTRTLRSNRPVTSDGGRRGGKGFGSSRPATASGGANGGGNRASKFKSRFGGDSDDENNGPAQRFGFRSRFADSDDDEPMSPGLAPVRGIPRRNGQQDGDSTDLSGEDDDPRKASRKRAKQAAPIVPSETDIDKAMAAARRNLGMSETGTDGATTAAPRKDINSAEGSALATGSLRQKLPQESSFTEASMPVEDSSTASPKRRGFMGTLLRRNRNSSLSVQQLPPASPAAAPALPALGSGEGSVQQSPSTPTGPSSPAFSKLIRRNSKQPPRFQRGDSNFSTATAPVSSHGLKHRGSTDWPLPPPIPQTPNGNKPSPGRPTTSDGNPSSEPITMARTMRGGSRPAAPRVSSKTVSILAPEDERDPTAIYSERTGRKKKFGMLRRAFRLND